ncbi:MAG: serine/threonine protein kinase, partial [Anaerolineales bacterium]|nr:serine/threonine protein kinase [Anaerolineales bacterium]
MTEENIPSFGKYQVVKRLDAGAMGEVYMAYQPLLERRVAIKVLHPHLATGADFVDRFKKEAAVVARLRHTNIMQVYDFDVASDRYYMVMEFLDGPTLKEEMVERERAGKPFTPYEIGYILNALASALDYAHARGMIHRDIKPANIMFNDEGQVVLTDFGIVHIVGDMGDDTVAGQIIGTPAYMSPEQGAGQPIGAPSDIYSLGVVLYQLVTGQLPFQAESALSMVMKHVNEPPPPIRQIDASVSPALESAIMKALSKDAASRYQRAGAFAQALRQAVGMSAEQALAAFSITAVPRTPPPVLQQSGAIATDDV